MHIIVKTQINQFKLGVRLLVFMTVIKTEFIQMKSSLYPHIPLVPVPVYLSINNTPFSGPPPCLFRPFLVSLLWVLCLNLHNEDEVMVVIFSSQCLPTCNPSQSPWLSHSSQIGTQCFHARPLP